MTEISTQANTGKEIDSWNKPKKKKKILQPFCELVFVLFRERAVHVLLCANALTCVTLFASFYMEIFSRIPENPGKAQPGSQFIPQLARPCVDLESLLLPILLCFWQKGVINKPGQLFKDPCQAYFMVSGAGHMGEDYVWPIKIGAKMDQYLLIRKGVLEYSISNKLYVSGFSRTVSCHLSLMCIMSWDAASWSSNLPFLQGIRL